jgi:hypothetical protein
VVAPDHVLPHAPADLDKVQADLQKSLEVPTDKLTTQDSAAEDETKPAAENLPEPTGDLVEQGIKEPLRSGQEPASSLLNDDKLPQNNDEGSDVGESPKKQLIPDQ